MEFELRASRTSSLVQQMVALFAIVHLSLHVTMYDIDS